MDKNLEQNEIYMAELSNNFKKAAESIERKSEAPSSQEAEAWQAKANILSSRLLEASCVIQTLQDENNALAEEVEKLQSNEGQGNVHSFRMFA